MSERIVSKIQCGKARYAVTTVLAVVLLVPLYAPGAVAVAPGASLQDAIDKAADGETITLAEGVYPESITITKPLTVIGAGWDKTTIGPAERNVLTQQEKETFFKRLEAAADSPERAGIALELAAGTHPSLCVKNAAGVTIRGLRVRGPYSGNPGSVNANETLVRFDNAARAVMDGCAVVGPSSNGVSIVNGSDVRIDKSLIAAVWGTGVQVYAGERGSGAKPAKVHLVDSDIRNCHHRCVTISGEGSVIERNRISGSAWHGIRYDRCSPTVTGNLIFGNARFGIYASGKTGAIVTENILWRNEMAGIWCLFSNADTLEGNTVVGNLREGIAISGGSTTKLTKNVIAKNPVGVLGSKMSERDQPDGNDPKPVLTSNVFWDNPRDFVMLHEAKPLPAGNTTSDPHFVAPEKGDFTLAPDSPARELGAGAAGPIALASPFPIQPGETAMIPAGETRDYSQWNHAPPTQGANEEKAGARPATAASADAPSSTAASEQQRERQRGFAKSRVRQDNRRFPKDVAAAEQLYQVADQNWRSEEARKSLATMIEKFPELNRTGCAVLDFGQWSSGEQRERFLQRAIENHHDCFYGNGVQVGAFARYLLGHHYREQGNAADAERLFGEIRRNYPDAITHGGDLLVAVLREEAKGQKPNIATQPAE